MFQLFAQQFPNFLESQTAPAADSVAPEAAPEAADTTQRKKKKRKSKKLESDIEDQPKTKASKPSVKDREKNDRIKKNIRHLK